MKEVAHELSRQGPATGAPSERSRQRRAAPTLTNLARCYEYWIALTDCDGFRIDTLKHVSLEEARNFCGTIKEFAGNLGKSDFFLVGEIAGGDYAPLSGGARP